MHKQILRGGIAGGIVSLQCTGPSSELGHYNSSAFSIALFVLLLSPRQDFPH